jgi:plastocyanin
VDLFEDTRQRSIEGVKMRKQLHSYSVIIATATLLLGGAVAHAASKYVCDEPKPETMCTAANTCGSASAVCTVNVTRSGYGANVKPGFPKAKNNQFFCIKAGTKVVWMSSSKNTGFSISFGTDSPFDSDNAILGGGAKPITVTAQTPGCYKYDAGAFTSGSVYGMAGGSKPELVILP